MAPSRRISSDTSRSEVDFYVDESGRGPWVRVSLADGETRATGLSRSQVLTGDPRVSVLVLVAVIDHDMHQSDERREDLDEVTELLSMLERAVDRVETLR